MKYLNALKARADERRRLNYQQRWMLLLLFALFFAFAGIFGVAQVTPVQDEAGWSYLHFAYPDGELWLERCRDCQ